MKVIKRKNLPYRLPLFDTLLVALALDHWNAPQWLWGVSGALFAIYWIAAIHLIRNETEVDVLNEK